MKKKKIQKNKDSISSLWDNIHIIRVPGGEDKEQEIGTLFEKIVNVNFSNLVKEIYMQIQEAQSPKKFKEAHSKTHHN